AASTNVCSDAIEFGAPRTLGLGAGLGAIMRRCAVFLLASALTALSDDGAARSFTDQDCIAPTVSDTQRIEACSALLDGETDATKRVLYLDARSLGYFNSKSFVRSLADVEEIRTLQGDGPMVRYHLAQDYGHLGYAARAGSEIEVAIRM